MRTLHKDMQIKKWGSVVVKWSACSPSTPTIRVRIQLTPTVFSVKFVFEKNKNKQKEAHFLKRNGRET